MSTPYIIAEGGAELAVDDRLIVPEKRCEVIDGEVIYVSPAGPVHASRHSKLCALLEAYVAEGFDAACDMLTRTSLKGDMAPDGSVYPSAPDPETGGRQLEVLAFEVVSTQSLSQAERKAAALSRRGVRRVFAVDLEHKVVLEFSPPTGTWEILPGNAEIDDPAFVLPLPVHPLVEAAKADDAMARALLAKNNPIIEVELQKRETRGEAKGMAKAIVAVIKGRGLAISDEEEQLIVTTRDQAVLSRWLRAAGTCATVRELLEPDGRR